MFSMKSLFVLATALLAAISQSAPTESGVVNALKQVTPEDLSVLTYFLTAGIHRVIQLAQNSSDDQTAVLKNYVSSISSGIEYIKQAKGDSSVPAQLDGVVDFLNSYVDNYKPPSSNKARAYAATGARTHQGGPIGESEGTKMVAPLANDINGLLQSNGAASRIYKNFDISDHNADGTVAALGNMLAPITLGASKGLSDYLLGPSVQSFTHGTYDAIAHIVGDPIDGLLGISKLSSVDHAPSAKGHKAQQANAQHQNKVKAN